jgi:NADH-quinone oxidoreductase subunit N
MAAAMTVFMLALLGFPIVGGIGFLAKWYVLQAALEAPAPQARLAVLLVVMTAVSAGYYLHVVRVMYMKPRPAGAEPFAPVTGLTRFVIAASAVLIVVLGLFPDPLARLAQQGATRPVTAETAAVPQPAPQPQVRR